MAHVIRISLDELQEAENHSTHGPLETALLVIAAKLKTRHRSRPLFVRMDFPPEGGLELRVRASCKRCGGCADDVALWEDEG